MSYALVSRKVKICLTCSRSVVTSSDAAKFICPRCRAIGRRIERKRCKFCGDLFDVWGNADNRKRLTCSDQCARYLIDVATIERHKRARV